LSYEEYEASPLWSILVDTVHAGVLYPHHKSYVERVILPERLNITVIELATLLGISIGEAIVILHELRTQGERSELEPSNK
jgi:CRP-like cAMP-binding protein